MKKDDGIKSTNYFNTFIEIADDCPVQQAEIPAQKGDAKTVPQMQFEMIAHNPYKYTQDDVLFEVFAERNGIKNNNKSERELFFSKGQPCLRASSLGKRYGWGVHCDEKGKVAIYAVESKEYKNLKNDKKLVHLKAMRSARSPK